MGHTFTGWNTATDGSGETYLPGEILSLGAEDVVLYAEWAINQYTVSYEGNGHDSGDVPDEVTENYMWDVIIAGNTGNLFKYGYKFAGWNTRVDGRETAYPAGDILKLGAEDITLYAQWEVVSSGPIVDQPQEPEVPDEESPDDESQDDSTVTRPEPDDDGATEPDDQQPGDVEQGEEQPIEKPSVAVFSDTEGHWGKQAIAEAAERQLINGYPDGTFRPNDSITRAEFTVILMKALQLEGTDASLNFSDLDKIGQWARPAIAAAVEHRIISGYGDGTFLSNDHITRAEMAVMIAKALGIAIDKETTSTDFCR